MIIYNMIFRVLHLAVILKVDLSNENFFRLIVNHSKSFLTKQNSEHLVNSLTQQLPERFEWEDDWYFQIIILPVTVSI